MSYVIAPPTQQQTGFSAPPPERALLWALGILCVLLLFGNLGGPALFEPDEGRNAEKAREILLLRDWITPHENFLPVLDKPIFFYWSIALTYSIFGISEWAARVPSASAALACLGVVYYFARQRAGVWVALWSTLILLTSAEFFFLARIVIADMTLTFFVSLALVSFYSAAQTQNQHTRLISCVVMYAALALGTLVKGLAGLAVPGMVIVSYLLLKRKRRLVRELHVLKGAAVYLSLVLPAYLWAGAENPGYLAYFLWEEHFRRYWTDEFHRSQSWYYFVVVLAVGFLPWTMLLPATVKRLWTRMDDGDLFLALWAALPLVFFSFSSSKLPHYLLPIFPPLAILSAQTVVTMFSPAAAKPRDLFLVWGVAAVLLLYFALGVIAPHLVTERIRDAVEQNRLPINAAAVVLVSIGGIFAWSWRRGGGAEQTRAFICSALMLSGLFFVLVQLQSRFSLSRSTKTLAQTIAPLLEDAKLILYDTYPTGLIFYLRVDRPVWVVAGPGRTRPVMDNPYLEHEQPPAIPRFGKILFTTEEFKALWKDADPSMRVLLKERQFSRFQRLMGVTAKPLAKAGEYLLVARQ